MKGQGAEGAEVGLSPWAQARKEVVGCSEHGLRGGVPCSTAGRSASGTGDALAITARK